MIVESRQIAHKQYFLILSLLLSFTVTTLYSQNTSCSFQSNSYYFASAIGSDKKAEQQAYNYLLKAISPNFQSKFTQANFNKIISKCGIIRYCHDGTKQTIAYVSKAACANCFQCQPTIKVTLSNIDNNSSKSMIQSNTIDFLTTIYCDFNQYAPLRSNKFLISTSAGAIIYRLWQLNPFQCNQNVLNLKVSKDNNIFEIEHVPLIFHIPSATPEEVCISFDQNGRILDFLFMIEIKTDAVNNLSPEIVFAARKFIENLKTACIIKDSTIIMKLLNWNSNVTANDKERYYIENVQKACRERGFINFNFQDIEICRVKNEPNIYGVSIKQSWSCDNRKTIEGFLTLLLELNSQNNNFTINTFRWSESKIDPCFPY